MSQQFDAHNSLLPFYQSWQLNPTSSDYNLSFSYRLASDINADLLVAKIQELVKLKAHLRQTFSWCDGKLVATIHDWLPPEINFFVIDHADFATLEQTLIMQAHDINVKSSIKLNIVRFHGSDECIALFNIHHIILDGISLDNFIDDLNQLLANNIVPQISAEEYIASLAHQFPLQDPDSTPIINTYIDQLDDVYDKIGNVTKSKHHHVLQYKEFLPENLQEKLNVLSNQFGLSIFNLLLLTWTIFVSKLLNQKQTLVTYPVNIRNNRMAIDGCFVNMLFLPLTLMANDTYLSIINSWFDRLDFFKRITKINWSNKYSLNAVPCFGSSNFTQVTDLIINSKKFPANSYPQIAQANLSLKYRKLGDRMYFSCEAVAEIFSKDLVCSILPRFFVFINKLLDNPSVALSTLDILLPKEKTRLLNDYNNTECQYSNKLSVQQLFEVQVTKTPNAIAVVFENQQLTYHELNAKANQLAYYLRANYSIKPDDIVALCLDKSEHMLVAILGVLKAGAAYVPLDANYPSDRVAYMLEDTNPQVVLTNEIYKDKVARIISDISHSNRTKYKKLTTASLLAIDSIRTKNQIAKLPDSNLEVLENYTDSSLAYIIYTSGTTGKPKGVMIEQRNVINFICALPYTNDKPLNATFVAPYVFDVSIFDIWSNLLFGHTLYILLPYILQDAALFKQFIIQNQINKLYLPAALLKTHASWLAEITTITQLLTGVEPLEFAYINKLKHIDEIVNGYGPTESTVCSTFYEVGEVLKSDDEIVPLGKPIKNTRVYVLDYNLNLLPSGAVGELYISGAGVARGYLNQPELTKENFINHSFQSENQVLEKQYNRLYKTGDLVRWLSDGNLEYVGRNDFQVKIRGYRIELGDIESHLISYPGIQQAVVIAREHAEGTNGHRINDKYLVAYYVSDKKFDENKLQEYLTEHLPAHMLPSVFIRLKKLPLTINGKLDRRALPEPNYVNVYLAPTNPEEQIVCEAFSKVLGLEKVGVNDDFFRLGGNSILAIMVVSYLQANFKINLADIFALKTPKKIATNISFVKDNFSLQLEQIKLAYKARAERQEVKPVPREKVQIYCESIAKLPDNFQYKKIKNVLLTGATGYLGCNILYKLLMLTDYNVYLLIRADTDSKAFQRVNGKFQFYFDQSLDEYYGSRLFVFAADIEKNDLGLGAADYQLLANKIDTTIHTAALTKHYGEYDKFYSANVQATVNLLELAKLTALKDFHYISTISVFSNSFVPCDDQCLFTEDDLVSNLEEQSNVYIKTKYEAEKVTINYRQQGINTNIYRVGNLAFISTNYRVQENIEDNAFFNRLKCLVNLKIAAHEIGSEEISPVDLTAEAIIKLFDKQELDNAIYHVFNPNLCNVTEFFSQDKSLMINILSISEFIDEIANYLNKIGVHHKLIARFLLHQGWLEKNTKLPNNIKFMQDRTNAILERLGFKWPLIQQEVFRDFIEKACLS